LNFMRPECFATCWQKSFSGVYSETDKSIPPLSFTLISSSHLYLVFLVAFFVRFSNQILYPVLL
jgi:hypothetical protein